MGIVLRCLNFLFGIKPGWHAVKIGSQVGWVSGKYSEIINA